MQTIPLEPVDAVTAVANTHAEVRRTDRDSRLDTAGLTVLAAQQNLPEVINAQVRSGRYLSNATGRFPTAVLGSVAVMAFAQAVGTGSVVNAPPLLLPERVAMVMGSLVAVGVAAGLLPALRAARVDAAVSLRGA